MLDDFKRALARVQSDYGFYIECQANPAAALADYDLSPEERSALSDPEKLADVLKGGVGISPARAITVKVSGKHDWVNRTRPTKTTMEDVGRDAEVASNVEAIKKARTEDERTGAVLRLMEQIG